MKKPVSRTRSARDNAPEDVTGLRAVTHGGRTIYVAEDADPSLLDNDALAGGDEVMSAALSGVLTELGARDDDAKVSVYKIENANGARKEAFLYECHPTGFSLGDLQESYGAGDYRVKVYGQQSGTNYKIIHANPRITIGPTREQAKRAALPAAIAAAPSAPADAGIATALGLLAQAVAKLGASAGGTRKDVLEEMETMARIAGLNRPAGGGELAGLQGALGLMTALKGVMGGADKIDDADAAPYQLMGKALETFSEIYRSAKGGAQPAADTPALAAPVAPLAGTDQPAPENDAVNIMLKGQLMTLLFAAKANDNPEKWGVRIYEDAPDEILAAIEAPDWFEKVCSLDASFSTARPWLEKVRAVVLEEIAAADDVPVTGLTAGAVADNNAASQAGAPNAAGTGSDKPT